jgi:hypothetical protein
MGLGKERFTCRVGWLAACLFMTMPGGILISGLTDGEGVHMYAGYWVIESIASPLITNNRT